MDDARAARSGRHLSGLLIACSLAVGAAPAAEERADATPTAAAPFSVGYRVCELPYTDHNGVKAALTTAVWYPTRAAAKAYAYPPQTAPRRPPRTRLALDAAPAGDAGPFPLVLFIHGGFGCAVSNAFLCEHLAANGYVVCASDYSDRLAPDFREQLAFGRLGPGRTGRPWRVLVEVGRWARYVHADHDAFVRYINSFRVKPASASLDAMIDLNRKTGSPFHGLIDEKRIGVAGHSMGGTTVQGLCGANTRSELTDSRIRAALILSAAVNPWEGRLDRITIPRMLMYGDHDEPVNPRFPRRLGYLQAVAPRYWLILKDAHHVTFGNPPDEDLSVARRSDPKAAAICRYGLAFFDRHLRKDRRADAVLSRTDKALTYYRYEVVTGRERVFGMEPPYGPGTGGDSGGVRHFIRNLWRKRLTPTSRPAHR